MPIIVRDSKTGKIINTSRDTTQADINKSNAARIKKGLPTPKSDNTLTKKTVVKNKKKKFTPITNIQAEDVLPQYRHEFGFKTETVEGVGLTALELSQASVIIPKIKGGEKMVTAQSPRIIVDGSLPDMANISYSVQGDEITITAVITNGSIVTKEYRLFVYNASGALIDKEPDLFWKNAKPNETINLKVTSRYDARWHVSTVYSQFRAVVLTQNGETIANKIIDLQSGEISTSPQAPQHDLSNKSQGQTANPILNGNGQKGTPVIIQEKQGFGKGLFAGVGSSALIFGLIVIAMLRK